MVGVDPKEDSIAVDDRSARVMRAWIAVRYLAADVARFVRLLPRRVRSRINSRIAYRRARRAFDQGRPPAFRRVVERGPTPWSPGATPPGDATQLPWNRGELWTDLAAADAIGGRSGRELRVLTPDPIPIGVVPRSNHDRAFDTFDLPTAAAASYRRINWHRDFKSGYEWNAGQFYLDVSVESPPGVDLKTPRELSRFQHLAPLAAGSLEPGGVEFLLQVLDWSDANRPGCGVNWQCAMDAALRAINWIWGIRLFEPVVTQYPRALAEVISSLHVHGRHIERNLEYAEETTNNHYLSDVAGLVYIGAAFPEFDESDRWLLFGLQELVSEMTRTVCTDGIAHEGSTNYHRLVAELFASCAALAERLPPSRRTRLARVDRREHRVQPPLRPLADVGLNLSAAGPLLPSAFYSRLEKMAEFTAAVTKPNGLVPQFGDNDSGRVHKLNPNPDRDSRDHRHVVAVIGKLLGREHLVAYARADAFEAELIAGGIPPVLAGPGAPASSPVLFPVGGIAVARHAGAMLAVICGPNGQGGRGGHGHNDKLSFELNVAGVDVIVDGGCPAYLSDPAQRNRYRATAAHSTIAVAGREQDRWPDGLWGLFRLPERSSPSLWLEDDGAIAGRHYGYGPPHTRWFRLRPDCLVIDDTFKHSALRRLILNLDPSIQCEVLSAGASETRCRLVHPTGLHIEVTVSGADDPQIGAGCFSRGYGIPVATSNFSVAVRRPVVRTELRWSD